MALQLQIRWREWDEKINDYLDPSSADPEKKSSGKEGINHNGISIRKLDPGEDIDFPNPVKGRKHTDTEDSNETQNFISYQLSMPLQADINFKTTSQYATISSLLGSVGGVIEKANTLLGSVTGTASPFLQLLSTLEVWQKTETLEFSFELNFYSEEDAFKDVMLPTLIFLRSAMMRKATKKLPGGKEGVFYLTPGVSAGNFKAFAGTPKASPPTKKNKGKDKVEQDGGQTADEDLKLTKENTEDEGAWKKAVKNAQVFKIIIPGVIYIPVAYMSTVNATFSKEKTLSGYPIWSKLECTAKTNQPAHDGYFIDGIMNKENSNDFSKEGRDKLVSSPKSNFFV